MQLNPCYLYPNKIDVYTNLGSWTLERYRKVYQRTFKVYRGVDNRLELQVRNSDQKAKNITGYEVVFNVILPESNELIKQKTCSVYDASLGKVYVVLTEADMMDLEHGQYLFSAYTVDADGIKTPLYGDTQFSAIGRIDVEGSITGEPISSQEVTNFESGGFDIMGYPVTWYVSDLFDAKPQFNSNAGLHTFAFYFNNYTGSVTIQGSLDNSTNPVEWVDIDSVNYNNSGITYHNVTGVWNNLRIKHNPSSGTIDKVLYRY